MSTDTAKPPTVPSWDELTPAVQDVYGAINNLATDIGGCSATNAEIIAESGRPLGTVARALRTLKAGGLVVVHEAIPAHGTPRLIEVVVEDTDLRKRPERVHVEAHWGCPVYVRVATRIADGKMLFAFMRAVVHYHENLAIIERRPNLIGELKQAEYQGRPRGFVFEALGDAGSDEWRCP